jgi:hypothetical protein
LNAAALLELIERAQRLEKSEARRELLAAWQMLGERDFAPRCVLAHYLADTEAEVSAELEWDLLALEAAERCTDVELRAWFPGLDRATFFPSLHLNLAQAFERAGQLDAARTHLARAENSADLLVDSPIGILTKGAIARLRASLG